MQASSFNSTPLETTAMKIPTQIEPALWGVAGGALAIAIAGFGWGGWTTVSHVEATALVRSNDAVVVALAPVCVDKFRRAVDADANLAALRKTDAWSQSTFVEKGGWASVPGTTSTERISAVAKACAALLLAA